MELNMQDMVAQAHPIYSIGSIIFDIIYGRTGGLLKKAYDYGQADNYQQMVLCGLLAAIYIAFVVAMIFAIGPWVKALIVAKFAASPFLAMTLTGVGTKAINCGFGWIVDAINRKIL
ncbi:hypothetical protein I5520_16735 [Citrobacter sp. FDAARGOS_156]|uniref:hypothetical protein n=1 Tax=Citrobacter sp. FDAARGOS_156 TaxID=1702170 RepID=UPI0019075113|nr:hypothetical protein [Citrobacter sp. FDAARGOS_156]MBJ9643618.1 hypothetical protein [Citrobacter sp. FDAARGOS_156]